jgi:hypothetical protein
MTDVEQIIFYKFYKNKYVILIRKRCDILRHKQSTQDTLIFKHHFMYKKEYHKDSEIYAWMLYISSDGNHVLIFLYYTF